MKEAKPPLPYRVVVFAGSGGVGKTTTAAAFALREAMKGMHVLCMTVDPSKRLADSLGLSMQKPEAQRVSPGLFKKSGLVCNGELTALMLDRKHTFDNLIRRFASSAAQRDRIFNNKFYQYISTSLAGTQEYMALEKLLTVISDERYDLVVLDTPPTSNALDLLDAPIRLVDAIDSPVARWFVRMLEGDRPLGLLGRGAVYILKGLSRFTGAEFLRQVAEFVAEINDLFGGFRQRADRAYQVLSGPDIAFIVVTSPATQAIADAAYFCRKLNAYRIEAKGIIVNRVHSFPRLPKLDIAEIEALVDESVHEHPNSRDLVVRMKQAMDDALAIAEADSVGIKRLAKQIGRDMSYTEVPALDQDVHDLSHLAEVAGYLSHVFPLPQTRNRG
ncbi:MAG: ArsA family ATPase [Deltaproteobacteria bacterium]|nr:ArsA family ATPase [Deltaproteobacteria bacterium]